MYIMSVLGGVLSGIVLLAFSPLVLSVANLSDAATEYLKWMLIICSYYMIGKSVNSTTLQVSSVQVATVNSAFFAILL